MAPLRRSVKRRAKASTLRARPTRCRIGSVGASFGRTEQWRTSKTVCAVVGVGPGNGEALARRFSADGYAVALMARRTDLSGSSRANCRTRKPTPATSPMPARSPARSSAVRADLGDVDAWSSTPAPASGARSRRSRRRISSGPGGSTRSASFSPRARSFRRCAAGQGRDRRRRRDRLAARRRRHGRLRAGQDGAARPGRNRWRAISGRPASMSRSSSSTASSAGR